jgi:hypothetical protein
LKSEYSFFPTKRINEKIIFKLTHFRRSPGGVKNVARWNGLIKIVDDH